MQLSPGGKLIIRRLWNQKRIGGKHIPETLCRSWIKHLPKKEYKEAITDLKRCIKEGIIITKPKPGDRHLFLNPHRIYEIKEIIEEKNEKKD